MLLFAMAMMAQAAAAPAAPATPVPAHDHAASPAPCTATDAGLPPDLAGWTQADTATGNPLPLGQPVSLVLSDQPDFRAAPARPARPGTRGAAATLHVAAAGRYNVAIDNAAWIDLLAADGQAARPAQFGHGPACSSIRKLLRFDLTPGDYLLQFSNAEAATLRLMVSRAP